MKFLKKLFCCLQSDDKKSAEIVPATAGNEHPHRHHKRNLSDKISEIEKIATAALREAEDVKIEEKEEYREAARELNFAVRTICRTSFPDKEIVLPEPPSLFRMDY